MDKHKWAQVCAAEAWLRDAGLQVASTRDCDKDDITKMEVWGEPEKFIALLNADPDRVVVNRVRLEHLEEIERKYLQQYGLTHWTTKEES